MTDDEKRHLSAQIDALSERLRAHIEPEWDFAVVLYLRDRPQLISCGVSAQEIAHAIVNLRLAAEGLERGHLLDGQPPEPNLN